LPTDLDIANNNFHLENCDQICTPTLESVNYLIRFLSQPHL
jgi:hypothetical protein